MSRGLSQQQRTILGIATHVNRLTQGGALGVKTRPPMPGVPGSATGYGGVKDLQWPLAAHLVGGLPFVATGGYPRFVWGWGYVDRREAIRKTNGAWQDVGAFFDRRSPAAKSVKASIIRAITSLVRTGHLRVAAQEAPFRWGYVLTEAGLEVGRQWETAFAPSLIFRAGVLIFPDDYPSLFRDIYDHLTRGSVTLAAVITALRALAPWRDVPHNIRTWEELVAWSRKHGQRCQGP